MDWLGIVVVLWSMGTASPPPVIKVGFESEALCERGVAALAERLGRKAALTETTGSAAPGVRNEVLTACIRVAD